MNWDDLRVVAAVRDAGTYAGAGTRLGLDETTVARRLSRLERRLALRLFEAADGARRPTEQCEAILSHIGAMARHVAEIGRIGESQPAVAGRFRIACTSGVAEEILAPNVRALLAAHAGLTLHFLTSAENVKFSRWEADFAVRLDKPAKGDFTISKLGEMALYFFEPAGAASPLVCAYPAALDRFPEAEFLKARGLQERARLVTDNLRVLHTLIRSRRAAGVLPAYFCQDLLADRRLRATPLPRGRDVWLLVQNHLRRDPAARVVIDWLRDCFRPSDGR
ncbi:MAG TPA: LysR family transcriptional regulator [Reyranella sp.]|nr:LysR family transcriptional regulator [Reyranella sp.]